MADNKVNFLRGTSAEYESSIKDNDTFYYTTDDEKLYLGDKEITGGGVTIDDALSDTSEHPVQNKVINAALNSKADQTTVDNALAQKANSADVTASLAGKSDTGHTHDDRYYTESETDALLGDKVGESDFNSHTNNTTVHVTAEEKAAWNGKAELTDIPTKLPANGGNADTLDGLHATAFYPAKGANTAGIDYDTLINTGLFEVNGTSTEPTTHSPNGNDSDNNFYVIVYRHSSSQCTQIAISAREDRSVYVRARANSTWGAWTSFFISNKPLVTGVTTTNTTIHLKWLPVNGATKYAVSKYNSGTSYTVYSLDITNTEYTITGLTAGTEYNILVRAYINDAWTEFTAADHIIVRTNALSSGTAEVTTSNCPSGAWYGKYE